MNSLLYLTRTIWKNRIKDLVNHPARLVVTVIVIVFMGISLISSMRIPINFLDLRDFSELYAMVLLLYSATFVVGSWKGFSSGASFYSMADVRMLFPSPLSPKKILLYGLIRQAGTSLLVAFILIYQYSWLHTLYGLTVSQLVIILVGFGICFFCAQVSAMLIYSFSSADEKRQRLLKIIILAGCTLFIGIIGLQALTSEDLLSGASRAANGLFAALFPVGGWLKLAVYGILSGSLWMALAGLLLTFVAIVLLMSILFHLRMDYYEDVLQATEVSFSAITAKKEGRLQEQIPKNVRVGRIGLQKGNGASAFFYKHLLENRRSRFLFFDTMTVTSIIVTWVMAFLMKNDGGLIVLFVLSTYFQILSTVSGRWVRELLLPYIYLAPTGAFVKLFWVCAESILKVIVEAFVLFIPVSILMDLSAQDIFSCILARISFGLLFLSGNFMIERVLGSLQSKTIIIMLYFLMIIGLCIPGVILAIIVAFAAPSGGLFLPFSVMSLWNVLAAAGIAFFCRDILNYAELNNR